MKTSILVLPLALIGCSTGLQGPGLGDDGKPPVDTGAPDTDTTETTTTTPGTGTGPTGTGTGTPGACASPPLGGSIPTLPTCEYVPAPSGTPFAPTVEWAMTNAMTDPTTGAAIPVYHWAEFDGYGSVYQAPVVMSATSDGVPDIAVVMAHPDDRLDGVLRLISGDGSVVHDSISWETVSNANGTHDYAPYRYAGVAMADLDRDGLHEIATVVTRSADSLCYPAIYEVLPSGGLRLDRVYEGGDYYCGAHAPAIADLTSDGDLEVIYGRSVFDPTLRLEWSGNAGRGWYGRTDYPWPDGYWNSGYHAFAYDMNGDGARMEVVAGRTVYTATGGTYCELGRYSGGTWIGAIDGYPAVADLARFPGDSPGEPEIVVTGNEYVSVYRGVPDALGRCVLVDELPNDPAADPAVSGGLPAHPNCDASAQSFGGPPTIADFDGDGDREIAVAGACWYSVYELNGARQLERYAMAQTKDWSSSSTGSTVFDFDGDGASEIVFSDEDAVYVWMLDAGAGLDPWERLVPQMEDTQHKSWTIHEYPLVADVDGDGKAEIVVTNSHLPGYLDRFGIYVLGALDDDWVSSREVWHQHAYHVTNVSDLGDVGYAEPNYAPYTSEDYNSFRTQSPGAFGALSASNLFAQVEGCQEYCGDLRVWVQVGNEGEFIAASPDVPIALYGVTPGGARTLLTDTTAGNRLVPGVLTDTYEFVVPSAAWSQFAEIVAVVDDPSLAGVPLGRANECDEADNEARLSLSGYCP